MSPIPEKKHENIFFVKSSTSCKKLADSLFLKYRADEHLKADFQVQAVGASAVNQAVKAVIIFNKKVITHGSFEMVQILPRFITHDNSDGETINVIELLLKFSKIH